MAERVGYSQQRQQDSGGPLTTVDLIERLSRFDGPPEQFLVNLLAVQCHVSGASSGSILRLGAKVARRCWRCTRRFEAGRRCRRGWRRRWS